MPVYCIAIAVAKNIDNKDAVEEVLVKIKVITQRNKADRPINLLKNNKQIIVVATPLPPLNFR